MMLTWFKRATRRSCGVNETRTVAAAGVERSVAWKQARPRICLIDVDPKTVESLQLRGMNCASATLGATVNVPNKVQGSTYQCLLNYEFPDNLHEYDVIVVDLQNERIVEYDPCCHVRSHARGYVQRAFVSAYPETAFDPRPAASKTLGNQLQTLREKHTVCIVFAARNYMAEYHLVEISPTGTQRLKPVSFHLYEFYNDMPEMVGLRGMDTRVLIDSSTELGALLRRHNETTKYDAAFGHPKCWNGQQFVESDDFVPLMAAASGETISFVHIRQKNYTFVFPAIADKEAFLVDLMERVLPEMFPDIFPFSTQFMWIKNAAYMLPNEEALLSEKEEIKRMFESDLARIDARIEANHEEHKHLHDLLTESGSALVKSIEQFFLWLGFPQVVSVDEAQPEVREEDLSIDEGSRLLVVEVKGIAGTSTDDDCAQISKVRNRRSRERNKLDVFGLYLVNHQRYLPPEKRLNPPFSDTQIRDAENDERSLLTTYELFKLYFNIRNGFVSKEDAREALFRKGLVHFMPSGCVRVPGPHEVHYNGFVVVFQADGLSVSQGQTVVVSDGGRYRSVQIVEIQVDGRSVERVTSGEIGVKLSEPISRNAELWLRCSDS